MCIAILNKTTTPIERASLYNSWLYNDDGAGIMWAQDGKLFGKKYPNDFTEESFERFYNDYLEVRSLTDLPVGLHFRIATHGMSEDYLHPFFVNDNMAIMHNGIISGLGTRDYSDTYEFASILSELPEQIISNVRNLVSSFAIEYFINLQLGDYNKVIVLDNTGDYHIFNEKAGHWLDGNWYSNDSYKTATRYYGHVAMTPHTTATTGVKYYGYSDDFYDNIWDKPYGSTSKKKESESFESEIESDNYQACLTCNENGYVDMYGDCAKCAGLIDQAFTTMTDDELIDVFSKPDSDNAVRNYLKDKDMLQSVTKKYLM